MLNTMHGCTQHLRVCLDAAASMDVAASRDGVKSVGCGKNGRKHALSFVVVVPGWTEGGCWASLSSSPYLRFKLIVAADDHGFCDGASHQRKDPYRESPYDTAIFVLQTDSGARRWPVSNGDSEAGRSLEDALRAAFAQGRPTAAAKKRQKR